MLGLVLAGVITVGLGQPGAPDQAPEIVRLEDLTPELLTNNPEIQAARKRYEAAQTRPGQESALPDPKIGAGWSSAGAPLPGYGLGTEMASNIGFELSQEIPFPGKRSLRAALAVKEAESEGQVLRSIELTHVARFKSAFHELRFVYEGIDVLDRNRDLLQRLAKLAEARYSVGQGNQQDLVRSQVEISLLIGRVIQLEQRKSSLEAEINRLLNRPVGGPLGRPEPVEEAPALLPLTDLQQQALERSPMLRSQRAVVDSRQLDIENARKEYYPDFEADYVLDRDRGGHDETRSGTDGRRTREFLPARTARLPGHLPALEMAQGSQEPELFDIGSAGQGALRNRESSMKRILTFAGLLLTTITPCSMVMADETRLAVKHDHLWGHCEGELIFNDAGVQYETRQAKHARKWKYEDVQQLGIEPKKVVVLTYRDRLRYLGKDQRFEFEVKGEVKDSLRAYVEQKLTRPLVSSVLPGESAVRYRIPVKHHRALRGTQGVLEFCDRYVIYRTEDQRDARIWQYEDLLSMSSTGPYQLRITAMERTGGEYGGGRNFVFDLKEKLTEQAYDFLWNKINRPRIDGVPSTEERVSSGVNGIGKR